MRLEWSSLAHDDRDKIFDFIEQDSPQSAIKVDERISEQVTLLLQFPELGRPGRVHGTRELVISRTPCIAAYCIIGDTVRILRVLHSAQLWPHDITDQ